MDEDWHAVCQAIFYGIEGQEWEHMYHKYVEIGKASEHQSQGQDFVGR